MTDTKKIKYITTLVLHHKINFSNLNELTSVSFIEVRDFVLKFKDLPSDNKYHRIKVACKKRFEELKTLYPIDEYPEKWI